MTVTVTITTTGTYSTVPTVVAAAKTVEMSRMSAPDENALLFFEPEYSDPQVRRTIPVNESKP